MREFHTTVRHALAALHDLFAMSFVDDGQHEDAKELSKFSKGTSKSQWKGKEEKKAAIRRISVDPKPFAALALITPSTSKERDDTTSDLLVRLKTIFEVSQSETFHTVLANHQYSFTLRKSLCQLYPNI